jgi:ABC-type sugar transport system ATPase subunit
MILMTKGVTKRFGSTNALEDVSIDISSGEFHALVGENGAGKSTLIKVLSGVYKADDGEIIWQGKPVIISNPRHSRELGITVIHQDRHLIPSFTVMENVYLGMEYETRGLRINWKKMRDRVNLLMDELGIHIPRDIPAQFLSPPQMTQTEIIRSMMTEAKLLILDEPTAALTNQEADQLFGIIKKLQTRGTAVLYVSHRLEEIIALSDRISVLKNGRLMKTMERGVGRAEIISGMTDNFSVETGKETQHVLGDYLLEVENLSSADGVIGNVEFKVRAGEILGLFGLGGSGRTESLECIYGSRPKAGGNIRVGGAAYPNPSPRRSIQRGMAMVCEDRRGKALITNLSVKENIAVSVLELYSRFGLINDRAQERDARGKIKAFSIKASDCNQSVKELSGGNQQKVSFAKALMPSPQVILCDEPTQGVDVKTRYEIHSLLRAMADQGKAVVFVSSDIQETLELADRVQIIARGKSRECFENSRLSAEQVLSCCYVE